MLYLNLHSESKSMIQVFQETKCYLQIYWLWDFVLKSPQGLLLNYPTYQTCYLLWPSLKIIMIDDQNFLRHFHIRCCPYKAVHTSAQLLTLLFYQASFTIFLPVSATSFGCQLFLGWFGITIWGFKSNPLCCFSVS